MTKAVILAAGKGTRMGDLTGLKVIASDGVANLADIEALKTHEHYNIDGVITGQAIYTGTLNLAAAIQVGHRALRLCSAGLIPFRIEAGKAEFLLLYNLFFEQWQFPRGGSHHNEGEIACARREFSEEAGLPVRKVFKNCRSELNYTTSIRGYEIERTVVYYLAEIGPEETRWLVEASRREELDVLSITAEDLPGLPADSHSFWYDHPWVSSDVILKLRFHASPPARGLSHNSNEIELAFWTFPADYAERLPAVVRALAAGTSP